MSDFDVISDSEFFDAVNPDYPGLEKVKAAVQNDKLQNAKIELIRYFQKRGELEVELIHIAKKGMEAIDEKKVEKICQGYIEACNGRIAYAGNDVNWFDFPMTDPEEYMQSTLVMTMNWHYSTRDLAEAYTKTGNEKYAKKCAELILDWIEDTKPIPKKAPTGRKGMMWRTVFYSTPRTDAFIKSYFSLLDSASISVNEKIAILKVILEHIRYICVNEVPNMQNMLAEQLHCLFQYSRVFPEFAESGEWKKTALEKSCRLLNDFIYPDGAYIELCYFCNSYNRFLETIKAADKNNITLPADFVARLEHGFKFPMYMAKPSWEYPVINDTVFSRELYGKEMTQFSRLMSDAAELFAREDLRYIATCGKKGKPPRYTSYAFPYAGYYIMRSDWSKDARYLLFDGGRNAGPHNHIDKLSIRLYAYGSTLISGVGYTSKYGSDEKCEYFVATAGQNTIMVDGKGQVGNYPLFDIPSTLGNTPWHAITTKPLENTWLTSENFDYAASSYEDGYGNRASDDHRNNYIDYEYSRTDDPKWKEKLQNTRYPVVKPEDRVKVTHQRSVLFVKPDYWIVSDLLKGTREHTIESMFHFMPTAVCKVDEASKSVTTTKSDAAVIIYPVTESNLDVEIVCGRIEPMQGWVENRLLGKKFQPSPVAVYTLKDTLPIAVETVLYPYPKVAKPKNLAVEKLEVKKNGRKIVQPQASGLAIKVDNGVDYYLNSYAKTGGKKFGDIVFDGQTAMIRNKRGKLWKIVMINGTELLVGQKCMVKAEAALEYLDAEYKEDCVTVSYRPADVTVKLFTGANKKVRVNGREFIIPADHEYAFVK